MLSNEDGAAIEH